VLFAEQDHAGHQEIEVAGAEAAGPAHLARRIGPGADQIDVAGPIDLAAAQEERVEPPLRRQIEQLDAAIGEAVVTSEALLAHPHHAARTGARQQRRRSWDGRGGADRHVTAAGEQVGDGGDQPLARRAGGHSAATRPGRSQRSSKASKPSRVRAATA
jgi:hypothetical protein